MLYLLEPCQRPCGLPYHSVSGGRSCSAAAPVCRVVLCPSSDLSTGTGRPSGAGHCGCQSLVKDEKGKVLKAHYMQTLTPEFKMLRESVIFFICLFQFFLKIVFAFIDVDYFTVKRLGWP